MRNQMLGLLIEVITRIRISIVAASALLLATSASANVGFFAGDGFTIQLQKTALVRLVNEEVSISLGYSIDSSERHPWGFDEEHFAQVEGSYTLTNLADSAVKIQVGFPLNGDFVSSKNRHLSDEQHRDTSSVADSIRNRIRFQVSDASGKYSCRYIAQDKDQFFHGLFFWDMAFGPRESRKLVVKYQMPLSETLYTTDTSHTPYAKKWYRTFCGCFLVYFEHVTTTALSWAGPRPSATFSGDIEKFRNFIFDRGIYPQGLFDSVSKAHEKDKWPRSPFVSNKTLVNTVVSPSGWKLENGRYRWQFSEFPADSNLSFQILFSVVPRDVAGMKVFIEKILGPNLSEGDYSDAREIVAALMGIRPSTTRVVEFAERQIWYSSQTWKTEEKLAPEQLQVLDYLTDLERKTK